MSNKIEVRLTSSGFVHTPGIFAWARSGYRFKRDRKKMTEVISNTYNLKPEIARGLLDGSLPFDVDGDVVKFMALPGTYLKGEQCTTQTCPTPTE